LHKAAHEDATQSIDAKPPKSYASRLTKNVVPYGATALPETFDTTRVMKYKLTRLAQWVKKSKRIVFFTGAGISTSCAIDDFRGSMNGVWSREVRGESVPEYDESFLIAAPSLSHMAIYELSKHKTVHVVTQNVDDLHRRSGMPEENIMELHGNLFVEECRQCKKRYHRNFDVQGMGMKDTGGICPQCGSKLCDFCLDWLDALPEDDFERARDICREADLVICLGTSLRVEPANKLPQRTLKNGGKVVIVNLQETPKDHVASMKINGLCDVVLKSVMHSLKVKIPNYVQYEELLVTVNTKEGLNSAIGEQVSQSESEEDSPHESTDNTTEAASPHESSARVSTHHQSRLCSPGFKPTIVKKRKRKRDSSPQRKPDISRATTLIRKRKCTSEDSTQKSTLKEQPLTYIVNISKDDPIDRLIYCRAFKFWVVGDKCASQQVLHNHGVEHTFQFAYSPNSGVSAHSFKIDVMWNPVCASSNFEIHQSFSAASNKYRVKVFDVNYEEITEDELTFRVPIARRRFHEKEEEDEK